jgi:hypothetical protein
MILPRMTAGISSDDKMEHLRQNPIRKGAANPPEDGRWSNDHRLAGEKATVAGSAFRLTTCGCRNGAGHEKGPPSGLH